MTAPRFTGRQSDDIEAEHAARLGGYVDQPTPQPLTRDDEALAFRGDPGDFVAGTDDRVGSLLDAIRDSRPSWWSSAACLGTGTGDYFAQKDAGARDRALAVCGGCDALLECRRYARDLNLVGIWGGETDTARRAAIRLETKRNRQTEEAPDATT